jgi:hypothetical protein
MTNGVFSDFEIDKIGVKFADAEATVAMNCVGSVEEELTAKAVTKKCRGVVIKNTVKGTGEGTLTISAHVPYEIFKTAFGMTLDTLKEGVQAYGSNSRHKEFSLTMHVVDEDGAEKYKAYPKCIFAARPTISTENGAEEVAEVELSVSVAPDEYGNGMYEALADGLDEAIATAWIDNFTPALVQVAEA